MIADKTTLNDLSIFHQEEELSVFHHLNYTRTLGGKDRLRQMLSRPFGDVKLISGVQTIIKDLLPFVNNWPETITNGTVMVIEKFYETPVADMNVSNKINVFFYKAFYAADFALARFSVLHFVNFVRGMNELVDHLKESKSSQLQIWKDRTMMLLNKPVILEMQQHDKATNLSAAEILRFGAFLRRNFKSEVFELIDIYSRIDAYLSMAVACDKYKLVFPEVMNTPEPYIEAKQLFHILLPTPTSYDVELSKQTNFLFLTGANMAGKSTLLKGVVLFGYLVHS